MPEQIYKVSFRCYFADPASQNYSNHYQPLKISDIPRWIEAYRFTHPTCISITTKIWFTDENKED